MGLGTIMQRCKEQPGCLPRKVARRALSSLLLAGLLFSGGCHAEKPWPLWESYAKKYLDAQGRVIDHNSGDKTTTEGEAYAMFFALVANDRPRFEKLVDWTEGNLAGGDLTEHLPAWSWGRAPDGTWKVLDTNSAADADLWMAYTLQQAGTLWHVEKYTALGQVMAERISHEEIVQVPNLGATLLPGKTGFHPDAATWYLNPSYMPPSLLAYFAQRDPVWADVAESLPQLVASQGGFVMDWLRAGSSGIAAMQPPSTMRTGRPASAPVGSYEAIRVYLWMGIADPATPGVQESLQEMRGMAAYLAKTETPPRAVDSACTIVDADGPTGFSAAVIPYLHALKLSSEEEKQQLRLAATKVTNAASPNVGLYGIEGMYYDQSLALFSTGWSEGRYKFDSRGRLTVKWK
jgi:endo-1,4-beta-D-glucanase Y